MPALRLSVLLAACLLLLAAPALTAQSSLLSAEDLTKPVASGSAVTYADLLKLIFPEKAPGKEKAPQTPPVRSLNGDFKKQPLIAERDEKHGLLEALPIKAQGRTLLLLYVDAHGTPVEDEEGEQPFGLLALFQTTPAPKLLDLVDVWLQGNTSAGFWTGKYLLLDLTPTTQACPIYGEHHSAGLGNMDIDLLWVHNERLERILHVTFHNYLNAWEEVWTETAFRTEPDKGREFPKVVARLTLKVEPNPDRDKEDPHPVRKFTRSYRGAWRWDSAKQKYEQISGDLDKLYKWYEKYY